jgi:hypothetical protein
MVGHRKIATTMTARPRSPQPKQLDAGIFQAEISSFALRLAAEGKAAKTIRTYTKAVPWFAAARLPGREQADRQDIRQWMTWLPLARGTYGPRAQAGGLSSAGAKSACR